MFSETVEVAKLLSVDVYRKKTYAPAVTYVAKIQYKNVKTLNSNGEVQVATGVVLLEDNIVVDVDDQITLPDGRQPLIVNVERRNYDSTINHTKIFFI